jgi:hypothetical protein
LKTEPEYRSIVPTGLTSHFYIAHLPSSELLGYHQTSLWDEPCRVHLCITTRGVALGCYVMAFLAGRTICSQPRSVPATFLATICMACEEGRGGWLRERSGRIDLGSSFLPYCESSSTVLRFFVWLRSVSTPATVTDNDRAWQAGWKPAHVLAVGTILAFGFSSRPWCLSRIFPSCARLLAKGH